MYIKVFVCRLQCGAVVHSAEEPVFHPKTGFYSTAGLTKIYQQISSLTFKIGKLKDFYNVKTDCMNQTKPKSADSAFYASSAVWTTPKIGKLQLLRDCERHLDTIHLKHDVLCGCPLNWQKGPRAGLVNVLKVKNLRNMQYCTT